MTDEAGKILKELSDIVDELQKLPPPTPLIDSVMLCENEEGDQWIQIIHNENVMLCSLEFYEAVVNDPRFEGE